MTDLVVEAESALFAVDGLRGTRWGELVGRSHRRSGGSMGERFVSCLI